MIARARPLLSGVTLAFETRLDPTQPRPICDAVLTLRSGGPRLHGIPWGQGGAHPGERLRGWAIEVDRNTEGIADIRAKAEAYRRVAHDPAFYDRSGVLPIPLWLVPDHTRAEQILAAWQEVWPQGRWFMLTDTSLAQLRAYEYHAGTLRPGTLLADWEAAG